jgi:hypothetical protein
MFREGSETYTTLTTYTEDPSVHNKGHPGVPYSCKIPALG